MQRYFKRIAGVGSGICIYFWKSKGFNSNTVSNHSITPEVFMVLKQEKNSMEAV